MKPTIEMKLTQERPGKNIGFDYEERSSLAYKFARWCAFQATALSLHVWKFKYLFFNGSVTLRDIDKFDSKPISYFRRHLPEFVDKAIIYLESKHITDKYYYLGALAFVEDKLSDDKIEEHTGHYYIYERMKERIEELHLPELRY